MPNDSIFRPAPYCPALAALVVQKILTTDRAFTAWQKDEYENHSREYSKRRAQIRAENRPESEMEALFRENREFELKLFASEKYAGKVGAFEGANYEAKGYYRPEVDCIMFTRSPSFCAVCRRAIERVISLYAER